MCKLICNSGESFKVLFLGNPFRFKSTSCLMSQVLCPNKAFYSVFLEINDSVFAVMITTYVQLGTGFLLAIMDGKVLLGFINIFVPIFYMLREYLWFTSELKDVR